MALTSLAVLCLALGSGLWLYSLLAQRRAWNEDQIAKAAAEHEVWFKGEVERRSQAFQAKVAKADSIRASKSPSEPSEARSDAMCGRRTFDDRGLQVPRRAVDCGADLALAQASLNSAASILHGCDDHKMEASWDTACQSHVTTGTH